MTLQETKHKLEALSYEELEEVAEFIAERQADLWNEQIEADAKAGRLDKLFAQALASHRAGESRPMDEVPIGDGAPIAVTGGTFALVQ